MSVPHRQAPMHPSTHSFMQHSAPSAQFHPQDHNNNVRLLPSFLSPYLRRYQGYLFLFLIFYDNNTRELEGPVYFEHTSFPVPVPKIMGYLISGQVPMKKQETHTPQITWKARNVHEKGCRITPIHLLSLLLQSSFVYFVVFLLCAPRLPSSSCLRFFLFLVQFSPFSPFPFPFFLCLFLLPFVVTFVYSPCGAFLPLYCSSLSNACIGSANNCKRSLSYLSSDKNIIPLSPS